MKLRDAIYGLVVGDALGLAFESRKRGSFSCESMIGFGTWNKEPGTWSDDSSLTLATCKSIKDKGHIDIEDMRKNFKLWLFNGEFTPDGETFSVGDTTSKALEKNYGLDDEYSNGNGSLMRILPLAFIEVSDQEINDVSGITHNHEISKEACRIYIKIAKELIIGESLKNIINSIDTSKYFSRIKILYRLEENQIRSTGYVVDTLEASLWCILKTRSYKEAVLKAVNLGDDTDTIGAVTGGLAAIIYGYESIDKSWIEKLKNKSLIEACLF